MNLTLEEAVIEALSAIDEVPDEEDIFEAKVGEYAARIGGFYWSVTTRHEYSNSPKTRGTTVSFDRRNAKMAVLRDMQRLLNVPSDVESDDTTEQQGEGEGA